MNEKLDIHDIQTLTMLNTALSKFMESVLVESMLIQMEVKRSLEETVNRNHYWQGEVENAQDQVALCLSNLRHCLNSGITDRNGNYHSPDCGIEQHLLDQAEQHLEVCRENLHTAKIWRDQIEQAINEFQKTSAQLSFLESLSERAELFLEETSNKYEEVQALEHAVGTIPAIAGIRDGAAIPSNHYLSDDQQIGCASIVLNEMAAIQTETWATLDERSRVKTLQEIEGIMAVYQSRPAAQIIIKDMDPHVYGYYDNNIIYINKSHLLKKDARDVVETMLHEGRHSYQHFVINHPSVHLDVKQVNKWRKNFRHYLSPSIYGQELYESQPVEMDARAYAENICSKIFGRITDEIPT